MSEYSTMSMDQLWEEVGTAPQVSRAEIFYELGCRYAAKTNYARAEDLFTQSRDLAQKVGEELLASRASYSLGMIYYNRKQYLEAIDFFQVAADGYQLCGRFSWQGDAIFYLAKCLIEIFDYDGAFQTLDFAAELYESEEFSGEAANVYSAKGNLLGYVGRQEEALECFLRAQDLCAEIEDAAGVARVLDRVAAAQLDLGRTSEAVDNLLQAKNTMDYLVLGAEAIYATRRLGEGYKALKEWKLAITCLSQSAQEYRGIGELTQAALADLYRAQCLVQLGELDEADEIFLKVEAYFSSIKQFRQLGILELSQGTLAKQRNDHSGELAHYLKALEMSRKRCDGWLEAVALIYLAEAYLLRSDFAQAQVHIYSVTMNEIGQQLDLANQIKNVRATLLFHEGNNLAAEMLLLEILSAGKGRTLAEERGKASELLARIREQEGRTDDAERLRASAQELERVMNRSN